MDYFNICIVGAGHGGVQSAAALRQYGFDGSICIIGRESEYPYERPPLSKDYLSGKKSFENILLHQASFWRENNIVLNLGRTLSEIDVVRHTASLVDGTRIAYGSMIWAAGGEPKRLSCPGADSKGVYYVRTIRDVNELKSALCGGVKQVVIVGAGYIGLETAAVLSTLKIKVTILESNKRVLSRVACEKLSRFYEAIHRNHGVDILLNTTLECIENRDGSVSRVRTQNGTSLSADVVIVGIGIDPTVEPLRNAGAKVSNGVDVDQFCRTSLLDIYAIGDCASHSNKYAGGDRIRLESIQNANDMAITVAKCITGNPAPYVSVPWFWSNQYDLRLQTVGINQGFDETLIRGDMDEKRFSIAYLKNSRVIALDCVNSTIDYVHGRKIVESNMVVRPDDILDVSKSLKEIATKAGQGSIVN